MVWVHEKVDEYNMIEAHGVRDSEGHIPKLHVLF